MLLGYSKKQVSSNDGPTSTCLSSVHEHVFVIFAARLLCLLSGVVCVSFERVFDVQTKQDEIFDVVARPVIDKLVSLCA